jgi:hypothetical protein
MGAKRHQHTIPRTYLEKFSHHHDGDAYFVDCLDKSTFTVIEELSVSNICVAKDYYTLKDVPYPEKQKIENFYSDHIEKHYNEAYKILIDEHIEFINASQRVSIINTLLSLYFRTPKVFNSFIDFSMELLYQAKLKNIIEMDFLGQRIDLENKTFKEIKKQIREFHRIDFVKTQLALFSQFALYRGFDGIVVIKLIGDQEFITSDNPVIIGNFHEQLQDLFSASNSIYVPIDPKHCVFIAPSKEGSIVNQIFRNHDNFIMHAILNDSLFYNSEKWIIGTKTGIKNFKKDFVFYSQPAKQNHPIITEMKNNFEIMLRITQLTEIFSTTGDPTEIRNYLNSMKETEIFQKNASFQKIIQEYTDLGIL